MVRVGIAGLGFMGKMHFHTYKKRDDVEIVAVCDVDEGKFSDTAGVVGNIEGTEEPLDLTGTECYTDLGKMLAEAKLDAVSICTPTYLHSEMVVKALEAGVDVLCEKPMALSVEQCEAMIDAQKKSGKRLQVGHCIRFWPEWAKAKEVIDSGEYGKVKTISFRRLSLTPVWTWDNWMMDSSKSGGALIDLHIHDSDFVQYLFGMPKAVFSRGAKGPSGGYGHVVTHYIYGDEKVVTAEGGWIMDDGFGFNMAYTAVLEKASIVYDLATQPVFGILSGGENVACELPAGDAYVLEIDNFVRAVGGEKVPEITSPAESLNSIRLVLAEQESATSGKAVALK